jgi:hypothetical protein
MRNCLLERDRVVTAEPCRWHINYPANEAGPKTTGGYDAKAGAKVCPEALNAMLALSQAVEKTGFPRN